MYGQDEDANADVLIHSYIKYIKTVDNVESEANKSKSYMKVMTSYNRGKNRTLPIIQRLASSL